MINTFTQFSRLGCRAERTIETQLTHFCSLWVIRVPSLPPFVSPPLFSAFLIWNCHQKPKLFFLSFPIICASCVSSVISLLSMALRNQQRVLMLLESPSCVSAICKPQGLSVRVGGKQGPRQREMDMIPDARFILCSSLSTCPYLYIVWILIFPDKDHQVTDGQCVCLCVRFSHQLTAGAISCS